MTNLTNAQLAEKIIAARTGNLSIEENQKLIKQLVAKDCDRKIKK